MNQELLDRIKRTGLLDLIRTRPPLYIGKLSVSALHQFLDGFFFCVFVFDLDKDREPGGYFNDWVAYRLGFYGSEKGYADMILETVVDESTGLQRFFELYDEFRERVPYVFATAPLPPAPSSQSTKASITDETSVSQSAETMEFLVYANPQSELYLQYQGFFVRTPNQSAAGFGERYYYDIESFRLSTHFDLRRVHVLKEDAFKRLMVQG